MKLIKRIIGRILFIIGKAIYIILDSIIRLIENLVVLVGGLFKGCLVLMSMGGCLFFILFVNLGFKILVDSFGLYAILLSFIFLLFGGRFASYLKYLKYVVTEYLFNTANFLMNDKKYKYKAFYEFRAAFIKAEEDRIREQQRRYYEQQRAWEEQFRQQWYYQSFNGQGNGNYSQGSFGQDHMSSHDVFKSKYERSCDILGVPYDADRSQIKSAYRKKAKEFHPDLNKAPDSTKIFQEITAAHEFLNDKNIELYKNNKN